MKYLSNSRELQDLFILSVLNGKRNGTYLEVGAAHPIQDNNTFLLENEFGWTGKSIEWNFSLSKLFNQTRKNECICEDARKIDYIDLLDKISSTRHVDYLQLDVDPPHITLDVLQKIDLTKYSFSIITFEHDVYRGSYRERDVSRDILIKSGYTMVIEDVMHDEYIFEDWYVNEKYMPDETWKRFLSKNVKMNPSSISDDMLSTINECLTKYD